MILPLLPVHTKSLKDLLEGPFAQCLLTNYMFDLPWLFAECPRLRQVPVLLVHGERDRHGYVTFPFYVFMRQVEMRSQ